MGKVDGSDSWDKGPLEYDSLVGDVDFGHWRRERWAMTLII